MTRRTLLPSVLALAAAAALAAPLPSLAEQVRGLSLAGIQASAASRPGEAGARADALEGQVVAGAIRHGWREGDGRHIAGIELRLAPGWKTYWRAPGDGGIPPSFDWSGSENLASVRILWPAPVVFELNGVRSIGYRGDVVLPVEVVPRDPARPVRLRAEVELGVCRDVCVPADLTLDATVAGAGAADPAIRAALRAQPARPAEAGLTGLTCRVEPLRDGLRVTASMRMRGGGGPEAVVIEAPDPGVWVSEAEVSRQGDRLVAAADMVGPSGAPFALDRAGMTVTVIGPRGAVEHRGCPAP